MVVIAVDDDAVVINIDTRADADPVIQVFYVFFMHAHAAVGDIAADGIGAVRPVDAIIAKEASQR